MAKIRVRLVHSTIGMKPKQQATVRCLGLRKIGSSREYKAIPAILGMIRIVSHLITVEEVK
ncbi:MAG: 50S ribosomal protein L30 [Treponema sp.]|nr:50S ribosomal protein L30 [Treponema sp.]